MHPDVDNSAGGTNATRLFVGFIGVELGYVIAVRLLLRSFDGGLFELELYWTAIRTVSALALITFYIRLHRALPVRPGEIPPRCLWATGMFLAPVLVGDMGFAGPERYLFAATSLVVGLREELAYRGILQTFLARKFGLGASLCLSNIAFVVYHWGVQPFSLHYVLQIFLCGMILGFVYHLSGSIILVAALHAVYDAIDAFTPYLTPPLPVAVCTIVLSATLALLLLGKRSPPARVPVIAAHSHEIPSLRP